MAIRPGFTPIGDRDKIESQLRELISSTVNSGLVFPNGTSFNSSRVTNFTILPFSFEDDLSTLPEMIFVFSFLDCSRTHELNKRLTEAYGPIAHIALTGMIQDHDLHRS